MRCFVGLPLPEEYQLELAKLIAIWKPRLRSRVSWTRPGNWHLTMKFLGDVTGENLGRVVQALNVPFGEMFVLRAGNGGFFPNLVSPRVVWAGLRQGQGECQKLAGQVERRMAALGFAKEGRAFVPHLTVARIKKAEQDPWDGLLGTLNDTDWPEARMDRVVLWESRLTPAGPNYRIVAEFKLEGHSARCSPRGRT